MKKILSLLLVICLLAGCSGNKETDPSTPDSTNNNNKVIKIGVYQPASGDNGAGGKQETLGTQYANAICPKVSINDEEYEVELVIVDNESSNDKGPTAAAQLVSKNVSAVLGSYGSGVSIAASDVFLNAGIPAIGVSCTNPAVTEGNKHYFRICFLDPFQGTVLANFAAESFKAKTAYCLAKLGDDYSVGLCHYFKKAFEDLGGTVVYETFPEGNSDFASYITNAKNKNADVFFSPVSTEAAALIIEQAASQGAEFPILAGDTWDSNVILKAIKGKDVDLFVTTFYQEGGDPEFDSGIKEWINSDPVNLANNGGDDTVSGLTAMGYDAYFTVLEAIKLANSTDPKAINEALWNVNYEGVSGNIAFEQENGDCIRDVAYVKKANTENAAWEFVAVQGVK